jgi:hypothetical protein
MIWNAHRTPAGGAALSAIMSLEAIKHLAQKPRPIKSVLCPPPSKRRAGS